MPFSPVIQYFDSLKFHCFIWVSLFCCSSQRAWLLKLLAVELHAGDMANSTHRDACQSILGHIFGPDVVNFATDYTINRMNSVQNSAANVGTRTISKSKVYLGTSIVSFTLYNW